MHILFKTSLIIFITLIIFPEPGLTEQVLTSPIVTNWGTWGPFERCQTGSKVIAVEIKTEKWNFWDAFTDNTCLNGIRFYCGEYSSDDQSMSSTGILQSSVGQWGQWGQMHHCNGHGFLRGFTLRSEEAETPHLDETAANNLRIHCSGSDSGAIELDGERWGEWTNPRICDPHEYICGLQTQVEEYQGVFGDDSALNNIRVYCLDLPDQEKNATHEIPNITV